MSATPTSELQFASNLHGLINLQPERFPEDHVKDLKEVNRLGITLPKLNFPKDFQFSINNDGELEDDAKINITLKSIKPPHKFQTSINCSISNTIYKLKEDLINSIPDLSSFEPKNFKFLIKGKVLNDSAFVKDVANDDVTITVFVSAPTSPSPAPKAQEDIEPEIEVPSTQQEQPLSLDDDTWDQFKHVLLAKYNEENSEKILKKLKQGWDL